MQRQSVVSSLVSVPPTPRQWLISVRRVGAGTGTCSTTDTTLGSAKNVSAAAAAAATVAVVMEVGVEGESRVI